MKLLKFNHLHELAAKKMDRTLEFDATHLDSFMLQNADILPQINTSIILEVPDDKDLLMSQIFFNKENGELANEPRNNLKKKQQMEEEIKRWEDNS